ncbi:DUF924 family protein [Paraburkholderia sp.]|uniref:DUF924 family protein n=1 Tax=Paraburkholderia sp. TaxID=1926495 RepID=UPI003D6EF62F
MSANAHAPLDPRAADVLECWFGVPGTDGFGDERKQWFARDAAFDAMLRERFGALIDAARAGELDDWTRTPEGALALVIVLDQFSRNCHRNTARAFAADAKALQIATQIIEQGDDLRLPTAHHRAFAYLPFEHDESAASQQTSLRLFQQLDADPAAAHADYYRYAQRHAEIVERFGRFPHRNALLGRVSTEAELAFLREPGSSF